MQTTNLFEKEGLYHVSSVLWASRTHSCCWKGPRLFFLEAFLSTLRDIFYKNRLVYNYERKQLTLLSSAASFFFIFPRHLMDQNTKIFSHHCHELLYFQSTRNVKTKKSCCCTPLWRVEATSKKSDWLQSRKYWKKWKKLHFFQWNIINAVLLYFFLSLEYSPSWLSILMDERAQKTPKREKLYTHWQALHSSASSHAALQVESELPDIYVTKEANNWPKMPPCKNASKNSLILRMSGSAAPPQCGAVK